MEHSISKRLSPTHRIATCTCGWSVQVRRGPNALAQTAKLKALINRHMKDARGAPSKNHR